MVKGAAPTVPSGEAVPAAAFLALLGDAALPMYLYDSETLRFLEVNDAAVRTYGWSREEFLRKTLLDIRPPEDIPRLRALLAGEGPWERVTDGWRHITRDGRLLEVEIHSHAVDWEGRAAGLVIVMDVSERLRTARALRESEHLFRLLAEHATDMIALHDEEGRFLYASPAAQAVLGVAPAELLGRDPWQVVHPDDVPAVRAAVERLRAAVDVSDITFRVRRPDGSLSWAETSGRVITGADPQDPARFITVSRDVSDRRRLEAQLLQSQKLEGIGRLAGGIAHDFNNLLTAIIGHADLAAVGLPAGSAAHEDLDEVRKAAERATGLTRQLLAFARRQMIEPRPVQLNELVAGMASMLRRILGESVDLSLRLLDDLWPVQADPTQLEQVVMNLAVNARDAMPRGGRLTVSTANVRMVEGVPPAGGEAPAGEYVQLVVTDTGSGMDAETIRHIFEPFFTTKEVGKGTGLGLATTYGIVKQSGGHISVASSPGRGTTFTLLLPRAGPQAPGADSGAAPAGPGGGETILLAEDDAQLRRLAVRTLSMAGYQVLEAEDGEDALGVAARHPGPVHLLLTDIVMPRMGGLALAERLRARNPALRVLFVSGYAREWIEGDDRPAEEVSLLPKPWTTEQLLRRIRERLDAPA